MQNQQHNHLQSPARKPLGLSGIWKVTAAVTQKHVNIVKRRNRRASDIGVTKSIQDVQSHVLPDRCKCTEKFPALIPCDLLHGRSQIKSQKRNTKINVSSVSCDLV